MVEVLRLFLAAGAETCARLDELGAEGGFDDIRHLAHDLKGMAGYVGAAPLVAQAAAIEEAARDGNRDEIRSLLPRLAPTWATVQAWLQEHLNRAA